MKTPPIENIFPQEPNKTLEAILKKLAMGITELVSFGTHLIHWDFQIQRGKDTNIPTIFLRNCIELADAIAILIEKSSIDPAKIQFRALMENSLALQYMIDENESIRAHCFLVCKAIKDIKYYKQFVPTEETSKNFVAKIKKQEPHFDLSSHANLDEILYVIQAKEGQLKEPIYDSVYEEFVKTCKEKRTNDPNWYSLYDGPSNFEELCKKLEYTIIYEFAYRKYSQNVHGIDVMKGFVSTGKGTADMIQIRDFEDCKEVFYYTVNILLDSFTKFITKRLPNKTEEYKKWHNNYVVFFDKLDEETQFNYNKHHNFKG